MSLKGGYVTATQMDHTQRRVTSSTAPLLIAPGLGIAAAGALMISGHFLALITAPLFLPLITVVAGRAGVLWRRQGAGRNIDRRGFLLVSLAVVAATLMNLESARLGPAQLIALGFTYLGWIRRDALVAGTCAAAFLAVTPVDFTGPLTVWYASPVYAGIALITVAAVMVTLAVLVVIRRRSTPVQLCATP